MRVRILSMLTAMLMVASTADAQQAGAQAEPRQPEVTLKVGDKAPPLGKGEWVQGEPVTEFESGKVYVIENWATWCGPCIAAIPHINELQKKYADQGLVIIGQNMWESDAAAVKPFVEKMGEKMTYRVVMDEPSGQQGYMAKTYMAAAGQNGIPAAFVIDQQGRIAWIGHPMQMEPVLKKVLAGEFDAEAEAEKTAKVQEIEQRLVAALQQGDTDAAFAAADEILEVRPEMAGQIAMFKFNQLGQQGKWDEAYQQADKAVDQLEDAQMLNQIAWMIVDPQSRLPEKNLDVAMKAAEKANKLAEEKDGAILDTVARVHFLKGDTQKAIELQQKAIQLTDDEQQKQQMQEALREYQSAANRTQ